MYMYTQIYICSNIKETIDNYDNYRFLKLALDIY